MRGFEMKFVDACGRRPADLRIVSTILVLTFVFYPSKLAFAQPAPQGTVQPSNIARAVGTIKSISGNIIVLAPDAGPEVTVIAQPETKLVQVAPGQKDLKDAVPMQLQVLQPGDRILVRGKSAPDGKSIIAVSIFSMKQSDVAQKRAKDRDEWRIHGIGGVVSGVDSAAGKINLTLSAIGEKKSAVVVLSKDTVSRRYSADSVKFDEAKIAPLDQIKAGDQLRARGTKNADGTELAAAEIVSGTFRNIAGLISKVDAGAGTITVEDAVAKKPVVIKITAESQLRKLPPPMAQRIAMRIKGVPPDATPAAQGSGPQGSSAGATPGQSASPAARPSQGGADARPGAGPAGPGGMGRAGGGPPDLQQAMSRLPALALADLQKGDAVMVVTTEGSASTAPFAITLLSGVEAILEASPKNSPSTLLSPWSLSGGEGGEGSNP
jgi:hypothetical protein